MRIKLQNIVPDPEQPRKTFNDETIAALGETYDKVGLIQPITVRPQANGKYMIIVGERRFRAARERGDTSIECIVREVVDDKTAREMQFAEGSQQEDTPPLERGEAYYKHRQLYGMSQEELAKIVGMSHHRIAELEKLYTDLSPGDKKIVTDYHLDSKTAYAISTIKDPTLQTEVATIVAENSLTRDTTNKVVAIAKSQPDKLGDLRDIAKLSNGTRESSLDAILEQLGQKTVEQTQELLATIQPEVQMGTPEGLRAAAQTLNREAAKQEKAQLTNEQIEAKRARKKAKKEQQKAQKETQAKEKAEKLSLEDIEAIAEKAVAMDAGRAKQLQAKLGKRLDRKERNTQRAKELNTPPLPQDTFRAIIIDPPWSIEKIAREERLNQYDMDYPTMTLEQITALPVADLAAKNGCHIYLWVTHKHLPDAFDILDAWDAKYQCLLTWVKKVGMTPFSFMYSTEHCLFARIGDLPLLKMGERLDFKGQVREHSRKPDEFYDLVRRVSPEPRLDMFGREQRDGFTTWGNEPDKFKTAVT